MMTNPNDEFVSACILPAAQFEAVRQQIPGAKYLCAWDVLHCLVEFETPVRREHLTEVWNGIKHENRTSPA